ncbi:MAG: thermonuclease family protein [Methanobrevibacter sp.]|nr:thermonuclease family protein [Methanobrevibacter sp.]
MKENTKRIIMILFLVFALLTVGGKLLTGIDQQGPLFNNDSLNSQAKSNTNNYNFSQHRNGTNITTENYEKYYEAKGLCNRVIDGDTINVEGVGKVQLVGIDAPEVGQPGFDNSTQFVKDMCLGKTVYLDIDDARNRDKYGRILAIVYVDGYNINEELLKRGYAQIMHIPPSEFDPYTWLDN